MKKQKRPYHSIRKPEMLGGNKALINFLSANMVYPAAALENGIGGIAHVKCEIDDKGRVLRAASIHPLGYGLDEEAVRLCMMMKFANTTEKGFKIKHTHTIRIPFKLPETKPVTFNYNLVPENKENKSFNYTIKL
jgi:protein TonB